MLVGCSTLAIDPSPQWILPMTASLSATTLAFGLMFDPAGGWFVAITLSAAFMVTLRLAYRRTTQQLSPQALRTLRLLRTGAAMAVLLVLLRPAWVATGTRLDRPLLLVLRDISPSMTIGDAPPAGASQPGTSRDTAVCDTLAEHRPELLRLASRVDLIGYTFSDQTLLTSVAEPAPPGAEDLEREVAARQMIDALASPIKAQGRSSRIGDCLERALQQHGSRKIAAVLLLTDAANNLSDVSLQDAARAFGKRGIPIHVVGFGSDVPTGAVREIIARTIDAKPTVFVGNRIDVAGDFRFHGLKGRSVTIRLLADSREVDRRTVPVPENRFDHRVRIPYHATDIGSRRLELRADPVEGEAVADNNALRTSVDVLKGGLKVLLVQGSPLTEGRFIFSALRQAGQFDVDSVAASGAGPAARQLPDTVDALARYRAVLFVDVPRSALSDRQLTALRQAVATHNVGFLMTGGPRSFGPGGYAGSPIAELLPVRMAASDGFVEQSLPFQLTALGIQTPMLQLEGDAAASRDAWASLPPSDWANRVGRPKDTADVLAEADGGVPLLVVGRFGGRVAVLTVGATWRWQLGGKEDPPGRYFKRFWRQLVLHLTGHASRNLWVATSRKRYSLSDLVSGRCRVQVSAGVTDRQGKPVTDAACTLSLAGPGGRSRSVPLPSKGDAYATTLEVADVGEYELRLMADRGETRLGEATTRFVIYEPHMEWEQPLADTEAMADIARLSGGRHVARADLDDLLTALATGDAAERVRFTRPPRGLWDNRFVLAVFAAFLAAEWVLRKRWGLV
jgi:uncharacterized membrane protein